MIKIAHFGTFDVDNYGDLLFPYIAEYRLPKYDWEHISPTNNNTVFKDSLPIISFDNAKRNKYHAIVIGGGNILHLKQSKNTVYKNMDGFAYANLWVGAAKMAMEQKIPYIFNAPGVSKKIKGYIHEKIAQLTFENSNYVALREKYSLDLARRVIKNPQKQGLHTAIIPDTAFEIDRMWPIENKDSFKYISVNLNSRYHKPTSATAQNLDEISLQLKMPIKLIIIGDCHGDKEFTQKVSSEMKTEHEIFQSDSLKKIAHIIGCSSYFFGSSMHAFITAMAFGVPAFLILNKMPAHKFIGLLEITEIDRKVICESFEEVREVLEFPAILKNTVKKRIQADLDAHWNHVDDIIKKGKPSHPSILVVNYNSLLRLQLQINKIKNWI